MMSDVDYLDESQTTEISIRTRMLKNVTVGVDKSEGSYVFDSLSPAAIENVFIGMALRKTLQLGFAQKTEIDYLAMRAEEHGVYRKDATYATGTLKVTGTPKTVIPNGLKAATEADAAMEIKSIYFMTTTAATIGDDGTVNVPIIAVESGSTGNVAAGSIVVLATSRKNISAITNEAATEGGVDIEAKESLLARYLEKVRNPGTSGNKADYKQWAASVDGVGDAHAVPLWNGEGTVKVVILGADKKPASADIVSAVQKYICETAASGDRKAPIGATVTVVPATTVEVNIDATVVMSTTAGIALSTIKETLTEALTSYLAAMAFQTSTIRYSRIGAIILDQNGVLDYASYFINSKTANLEIKDDEVAVVGAVTLHAAE